MKVLNLPLYPIILCVTLGYLFSEYLPLPLEKSFLVLLLLLFGIGVFLVIKPYNGKGIKSLLLYLFFCGFGMVHYQNYYQLPDNHYTKKITASPEQTLLIKLTKEISSSTFSKSYYAEVLKVATSKTRGRILLNHIQDSMAKGLNVGDQLLTKISPKPLKGPRNPGAFDYRAYLNNIRIYETLELKGNSFVILQEQKSTPWFSLDQLKKTIEHALQNSDLSEEAVGLLEALVLGNRKAINSEIRDHYAKAGIIHILAISGLHIGILTVFLMWVLRPLLLIAKGKWIRFLLVLAVLWSYAFFIGMSASVVRAVSMFSILIFSESLRGYKNTLHFLFVSFFILLLCYPPYLKAIGFQMSYLAVFGILWFTPILLKYWSPKTWGGKKFWQLSCVCIGAQVAVAPLSIYYFHQFPGLFLLSNWVILPLFSLLLIGSMLLSCGIAFFPLPSLLIHFFNQVVFYMNTFISWIARQEAFLFQNIILTETHLILIYLLLASLILTLKKRTISQIKWVLIILIILQLYQFYQRDEQNKKNVLWVLHEHNESLLIQHQNKSLFYHGTNKDPTTLRSFQNFLYSTSIKDVHPISLKNFFVHHTTKILIIKDDQPNQLKSFSPSHIVLMNSPKINLDRLLSFYTPRAVIADGSNAPWMTSQWEKSCLKKGIPFHDTRKLGAYRINLETLE